MFAVVVLMTLVERVVLLAVVVLDGNRGIDSCRASGFQSLPDEVIFAINVGKYRILFIHFDGGAMVVMIVAIVIVVVVITNKR